MALDQHWKDLYSDIITDLAGDQFEARLGGWVDQDNVSGENAWFDSYAPLDEATDEIVVDDSGQYRMEYEENGVDTFAAWSELQTPHTQVSKSRSLCVNRRIEAGYTFRELDEVCENADNDSRVLKNIMRRVVKLEDAQIINGMTAPTQQRGRDLASITNVPFPTTQIIAVPGGVAAFDKDVVAAVSQKFEEAYIQDEQIYMIITPAMKAALIINSGNILLSSDFIGTLNTDQRLQRYKLPDVYGVRMIIHPLMGAYDQASDGAGGTVTYSEGIAVAFTREWGVWNKFKPLEIQMEEAPLQRFSIVLYIREFCNSVRIDDKRVVIVGFGTT